MSAAADGLNSDLSVFARIDTNRVEWQVSPSPSVFRKRLDLAGDKEASRVTSVVRYEPGSRFHSHPHPDGEEILVLDGVFSDEHGDYPAGTFLLNPEGFEHAPRSKDGCILFVKLRQYPGARRQITVDTTTGAWRPGLAAGIEVQDLYREDGHPEHIRLARFAPGAATPEHVHAGGEEVFVLEGSVEDEHGVHPAGTWVRYPAGSRHTATSPGGALLYVKSGHLA
ncbi:cupin domain-containing protein [Thalassobaculum sp. OXR-137]|uniref:cupin domain-containing protein n=1 Tax=Thalassobaculum sp. OXR-137 TaxID=3100173 RepID=UPI002AC93711|nr:cupin domain-containing protein [Thalassobaculum sp. OXR-137]WPZ34386.1 cupin domain-containing protein [Thalassobaculum sp. OXR-137]